MTRVSSPAVAEHPGRGAPVRHRAPLYVNHFTYVRESVMNLLMPDLGKAVYFLIGAYFGGKLLSKVGLKG